MRRYLTSLGAAGFLGALLGCHHTAGICDCDFRTPGCGFVSCNHMQPGAGAGCATCGAAPAPVAAPAGKVAEPLKEMPREKTPEEVPPMDDIGGDMGRVMPPSLDGTFGG